MKNPEEITSIEYLIGYTIVAAHVFGPIIIWNGDDYGPLKLSMMRILDSGRILQHIETKETTCPNTPKWNPKLWARRVAETWLNEYDPLMKNSIRHI